MLWCVKWSENYNIKLSNGMGKPRFPCSFLFILRISGVSCAVMQTVIRHTTLSTWIFPCIGKYSTDLILSFSNLNLINVSICGEKNNSETMNSKNTTVHCLVRNILLHKDKLLSVIWAVRGDRWFPT